MHAHQSQALSHQSTQANVAREHHFTDITHYTQYFDSELDSLQLCQRQHLHSLKPHPDTAADLEAIKAQLGGLQRLTESMPGGQLTEGFLKSWFVHQDCKPTKQCAQITTACRAPALGSFHVQGHDTRVRDRRQDVLHCCDHGNEEPAGYGTHPDGIGDTLVSSLSTSMSTLQRHVASTTFHRLRSGVRRRGLSPCSHDSPFSSSRVGSPQPGELVSTQFIMR